MKRDRVIVVDWSSSSIPKRGKDSIWLGIADHSGVTAENIPTRQQAAARLSELIRAALAASERVLVGVDFALGYPAGFAHALTGQAPESEPEDPFAVWNWLAQRITDTDTNQHNLRNVAAEANALFPGDGPFWGNGAAADMPGLPRTRPDLPDGLHPARQTDALATGAGARPKSVWQLAGAGAVGAQTLVGLPVLHRLRQELATDLAVWPFQPADAPVVLAEVYPSMLSAEVKAYVAANPGVVVDDAQVRLLAQALFGLAVNDALTPLFDAADFRAEGQILGAGHQTALRRALPATQDPPRLRDDCFAMPQGVDWVPVDTALSTLRAALHPVTGSQLLPTAQAAGRILSQDCIAQRANPPRPNSAVDGFGFAHAATGTGPQRLPLVDARAAAGQPYDQPVPFGQAIRILTGAILPQGVDTVVLEEDTANDGAAVVFDGPVKPGANTRKAGEDVDAGATALPAGHRLRAPDLALLSALGIAEVPVNRPLRVGVVSTGDEIIASPDQPALPHQIWDANRPMLLSLAETWGYVPVDLGHVQDDADQIAQRLDDGAARADVILTSGGASAGDEDHVSALLRTRGTLSNWRIALKPGRPLALAMWQGAPVFGLPGNPVAALVCTLIFARPALSLMAGAGWQAPQGFWVPAAFAKRKKPGRQEYLRARLTSDGTAEVFQSEGSGRISGLSWADGLVELPDTALDVQPGTMVRYLPYASFGLV